MQASEQKFKVNSTSLGKDLFELNDRMHAHIYKKYAPVIPTPAQDKPLDLIKFAVPHIQNAALIHIKPLDAMAIGAMGVQRARGIQSAYNEYRDTRETHNAAVKKSESIKEQIKHTTCALEKKSLAQQLIDESQIVHDTKPKLSAKAVLNNAMTKNPSKLAKAVIVAANADSVKDFGEIMTYGKKKFDEMEYDKIHNPEDFCTVQ